MDLNLLSEKEKVIIELLAKGLTNQDIADKIGLAEKTVKFHLTNIFKKYGFTNRVQAAVEFLNATRT